MDYEIPRHHRKKSVGELLLRLNVLNGSKALLFHARKLSLNS